MIRIGNSKNPTTKQMLAIASNLRDHLDCYVSISVTSNAYTHISDREMEYTIYTSLSQHKHFKTWPKLLKAYRKIMEEGLPSAS